MARAFGARQTTPHPDWVDASTPTAAIRSSVDGAGTLVVFAMAAAPIVRGGEAVDVRFDPANRPCSTVPRRPGCVVHDDEVVADFGFAGEVRVTADRVKVSKRFLGWANFVFDTNSPFFGRSAGEVLALIVGGPDLEPGMPNWSLAFDNIWNNAAVAARRRLGQAAADASSWPSLGTLLGAFVAFPLAFLAARNITPNRLAQPGDSSASSISCARSTC